MKAFKNLILFFCILFCTTSTFAYTLKEGNVTAIVGPFFYKTNFGDTDTGAKSPILGDVALIIEGDINDHSALEIGLFHMHKLYLRQQDGNSLVEQTQLFDITLGYRYFFNPYVSLAVAFYSAFPLADVQVVHNDFPAGTDFDTSARDTSENGFDFSLQTELWHKENLAVVADARYALSTTNKSDEKGDHYGLFIGVKFMVQEKERHNEKKE